MNSVPWYYFIYKDNYREQTIVFIFKNNKLYDEQYFDSFNKALFYIKNYLN